MNTHWPGKLFKTIAAFSLCLAVASVDAATELAPQEIDRILTGWSFEGIYFRLKAPVEAEDCARTDIVLQNDHPYFDQILSIGLSALHEKKQVRLRVDGCATNGALKLNAIHVIS